MSNTTLLRDARYYSPIIKTTFLTATAAFAQTCSGLSAMALSHKVARQPTRSHEFRAVAARDAGQEMEVD